jgi:D-sedoheptulose 7-phosphate isomerase
MGGKLLALGNGGSATDAMDVVADFRYPPVDGWQPRRAIDLTEDPAILTAIANDIGTEAIFARQIIAYGSQGDALLALSTSGNSANVIAALAEARRRGLRTIAMVGYDGGRVAGEQLADHVIVTRSEHIPRIQEAQASAYHVLRELVA